jgi:hypothetical protein
MTDSPDELAKSDLPRRSIADPDLQRAVETTLAPDLQKLRPHERQHVIQEMTMMVGAGPFLPPAIARQFEEMCPGFVNRSLAKTTSSMQATLHPKMITL